MRARTFDICCCGACRPILFRHLFTFMPSAKKLTTYFIDSTSTADKFKMLISPVFDSRISKAFM